MSQSRLAASAWKSKRGFMSFFLVCVPHVINKEVLVDLVEQDTIVGVVQDIMNPMFFFFFSKILVTRRLSCQCVVISNMCHVIQRVRTRIGSRPNESALIHPRSGSSCGTCHFDSCCAVTVFTLTEVVCCYLPERTVAIYSALSERSAVLVVYF